MKENIWLFLIPIVIKKSVEAAHEKQTRLAVP